MAKKANKKQPKNSEEITTLQEPIQEENQQAQGGDLPQGIED